MSEERWRCGFVLFERFTPLDVVGPYEVLSRCPLECVLVAKDLGPVASEKGLRLLPEADFATCPPLDILVVPGGPGQTEAMTDEPLIHFIQQYAPKARYVLGVCTGTLLLAAAGLLQDRAATTHWLAQEELGRLGARPVRQRVVWDGSTVTAAGVSSGIDMALAFVGKVFGRDQAERIQLAMEYDPQPPYAAGSPESAPKDLVEQLKGTSRFHQKA